MLVLKELNPKGYPLTDEIKANLEDLLVRMNKVRAAWGKPMTVTSGLRSAADQARINPSAPKSRHTYGKAVDILDRDGSLYDWTVNNQDLLAKVGLWVEIKAGPWVHYQSEPPKSGRRFFNP